MIRARHHWFHVQFFRLYTRFMLWWHFRQVKMKGDFQDRGLPVLLIGNHVSWWDGFIANYLNDKIFHRKFYVMMLEEQLKGRMFLNKAGAYSICRNSRSVIESIQYTRGLLNDPRALVTLYPQGEIRSMFDYPVRFEQGPAKILRGLEQRVQVVFVVALIDYFSHTRPTLTLAMREYDPGEKVQMDDMEGAFNHFLRNMVSEQNKRNR